MKYHELCFAIILTIVPLAIGRFKKSNDTLYMHPKPSEALRKIHLLENTVLVQARNKLQERFCPKQTQTAPVVRSDPSSSGYEVKRHGQCDKAPIP